MWHISVLRDYFKPSNTSYSFLFTCNFVFCLRSATFRWVLIWWCFRTKCTLAFLRSCSILVPVLVTYCTLLKLQVLHEYKDLDDKNPNLVHIFIQSKFSILSVRIEALFPGLWHCPTGRRHSYTASCLKGTKCKEDLNHCLLTRLAASQVSRWVNIYKHNCSC